MASSEIGCAGDMIDVAGACLLAVLVSGMPAIMGKPSLTALGS
jgi:hypothetical protein